MKLIAFNGSPRGTSSNSARIISWITNEASDTALYLRKQALFESYLKESEQGDAFLFVFPLYVDSMPGITKAFFEEMERNKTIFKDKPVYFIIHSGFPEMVQCRSLSRYTAYFSKKVMEMDYKGTVIIGGSEAMQMAPDQAFGRLQANLKLVKKAILMGEALPEDLNLRINRKERMNWLQRALFTITPGFLKHFYWHHRARQHKGKINLRARPYG